MKEMSFILFLSLMSVNGSGRAACYMRDKIRADISVKKRLDKFKNLKPSDKVSITDLHALGTDYRVEHLNDINLTLN